MRFLWTLAMAVGIPSVAAAAGPKQLHISVVGSSGSSVEMSVPFDQTDDAIASKDGGNFHIDANDDDVETLRQMWTDTKKSGQAQERKESDKTLRTDLVRGRAIVEVRDAGKSSGVSIELPEKGMDALLGGSGDRIDVSGALRSLGGKRGGLTIRGEDGSKIRLWAE